MTRAPFPLWIKLALGAAALGAVPPVVVGLGVLRLSEPEIARATFRYQEAVADDVARTIEAAFVEAQNGLEAVGRALADASLPADARVALALSLVAANTAIDQVAIYDAGGAWVDGIREDVAPDFSAAPRLAPALTDVAARAGVAVGEPSVIEGDVRLALVVPIRAGGAVTGWAASPISLSDVQKRLDVIARVRFDGDPDSVYLVDDQMRVLAHPRLERAVRLASAAQALHDVNAAAFRHGVSVMRDVVGPDGAPAIGGFHPLAGRPLAVVTQVPHARAYAPLRATRRIVYATLAGSVALSVAAAFAFARGVSRPVRRLVSFAADLAARRFDRRVDVGTRDELSMLGAALNDAALELDTSERRMLQEAAIRADLGRFLPAELVDKVVRREHDMSLGGARRSITVLFADVVGFTPMAEQRRAEDMVTLLNELFTILTEIVVKHGGLVDKLIGDSVMALWGAVPGMPASARNAVEAALEMQRWLELGRASWRERYDVDVRLAIGINSGEAIVGNIGSDRQLQFTAIGDVVNVAAKVEMIARPDQVLVTGATRAALGDEPPCIAVGARALADRGVAVDLYEVRQ